MVALPLDTTAITLQFIHAGAVVPVTALYEVELRSADPAAEAIDLTGLFIVSSEGIIGAVDVTSILSEVLAIKSNSYLRVDAADNRGFSYAGTVRVRPRPLDGRGPAGSLLPRSPPCRLTGFKSGYGTAPAQSC